MQAVRSADEIRDVNTRYHDVAASTYDTKWGIDFGEVGQAQVLRKLRKALGRELGGGFERGLEIGAGTGYFGINLVQAGVLREVTCTDISPGMVSRLGENARRLGVRRVRAARADAESLPFPDASFDIAFGHAILHHLPDLELAFGELHRVLRPGGKIVFAGEPSRVGDQIASVPKRAAGLVAPLWRTALRAAAATGPSEGDHGHAAAHALEQLVDIHAFVPSDLAGIARRAGFAGVNVRGEELLANWFGWFNRSLESTAAPDEVPMAWRQYAFHGYLWLQQLDERALEGRLPAAIFYNLLLTGSRP